jgi:hypothetical protein
MTDIINIKDFYDHETRISIVENAIINIDKRFEQVDRRFEQIDRRFEQVDRRFEHLENKLDSHFKWIMGSIGGLSLTVILSLVTVIMKIH